MIAPADITPTLEEVASHILSRSYDRHGNRGAFTEGTVPTADEATVHVERAARYVALRLGQRRASWNVDVISAAQDAVALRAALTIEYAYFSDRSDGDVDQLGRMAREVLEALVRSVRGGPVAVTLESPYTESEDTSVFLDSYLSDPEL